MMLFLVLFCNLLCQSAASLYAKSDLFDRSWRLATCHYDHHDLMEDENGMPIEYESTSDYTYHYSQTNPAGIDSIHTIYAASYNGYIPSYGNWELEYDVTGNNIISMIHNQDEDTRVNGYYDSQNRLTGIARRSEYVSENGEQIEMEGRTHFIYNEVGYITSTVSYYRSGNDVSYSKYEYELDEQGRIITKYWYNSEDSLTWVCTNDRYVYTYYIYDSFTGLDYVTNLAKSFDFQLPIYPYPAILWKGMITSQVKQYYSTLHEQWLDSYRDIYVYGNYSLPVSWNEQSYSSGTWTPIFAEYYTYNTDHNLTGVSQMSYNPGTPINNATFTWQNPESNDDETTTLNPVSIYPNPVKDTFTIKADINYSIENVALYNLKGQRIEAFETSAKSNSEMQITLHHPNLPTGIYILHYTLSAGQKTIKQSRKIMVL